MFLDLYKCLVPHGEFFAKKKIIRYRAHDSLKYSRRSFLSISFFASKQSQRCTFIKKKSCVLIFCIYVSPRNVYDNENDIFDGKRDQIYIYIYILHVPCDCYDHDCEAFRIVTIRETRDS